MPNREDEYWVNQKENLRYCSVHKRFYDINFGCQLCQLQSNPHIVSNKVSIKLEECPRCKELSLDLNEKTQLYECLNLRCECAFSNSEVEEYRLNTKNKTNNFDDNGVKERSDKCPSCENGTLFWNGTMNLYECNECKRRLSRFMKKGLDKLLKD
jgi:ribosomal protein S27AE